MTLRGRFDEYCPHCENKISVHSAFEANDYESEFTFDCPKCERKIEVNVHSVPEFELFRPRCQMCSKTIHGDAPYCLVCRRKLQKLSDHNAAKYGKDAEDA